GLEHDRERRVAAGDLEERLRLQALLPERRPLAGGAAGDQQRTTGVLAEAGAEKRRLAHLLDDEVVELVGIDEELLGRGRGIRVRKVEGDSVVGPDRLRVEAERVAHARTDGHRPWSVYARAERRQDADAPVADLVFEALGDDRPVRGHR